jgi:hypothetical protein
MFFVYIQKPLPMLNIIGGRKYLVRFAVRVLSVVIGAANTQRDASHNYLIETHSLGPNCSYNPTRSFYANHASPPVIHIISNDVCPGVNFYWPTGLGFVFLSVAIVLRPDMLNLRDYCSCVIDPNDGGTWAQLECVF